MKNYVDEYFRTTNIQLELEKQIKQISAQTKEILISARLFRDSEVISQDINEKLKTAIRGLIERKEVLNYLIKEVNRQKETPIESITQRIEIGNEIERRKKNDFEFVEKLGDSLEKKESIENFRKRLPRPTRLADLWVDNAAIELSQVNNRIDQIQKDIVNEHKIREDLRIQDDKIGTRGIEVNEAIKNLYKLKPDMWDLITKLESVQVELGQVLFFNIALQEGKIPGHSFEELYIPENNGEQQENRKKILNKYSNYYKLLLSQSNVKNDEKDKIENILKSLEKEQKYTQSRFSIATEESVSSNRNPDMSLFTSPIAVPRHQGSSAPLISKGNASRKTTVLDNGRKVLRKKTGRSN